MEGKEWFSEGARALIKGSTETFGRRFTRRLLFFVAMFAVYSRFPEASPSFPEFLAGVLGVGTISLLLLSMILLAVEALALPWATKERVSEQQKGDRKTEDLKKVKHDTDKKPVNLEAVSTKPKEKPSDKVQRDE